MRFSVSALIASGLALAGFTSAQANGTIDNGPFPDDLNGSNFTYPWPVKVFRFNNQFQELEMAFMDVPPQNRANGKTIVMLHGKNFCGPTWEGSISLLTKVGYRVIAPDQVGFCKSTKPETYQFSLHQLAMNTRGLLDALGIDKTIVMGHSLGGMLTTRYGLQYPDKVDKLILVDPVGLEDYVQKGVPYIPMDQSYKAEAAQTYEAIKGYEQAVYYVGEWKESYATWVRMLINIYYGSEREAFLRNQAQIVDLVLTQPVVPYFGDLQPKTLLIVGDKDKTAIGAQWAPPEVAAKLGHFDELGPEVAAQIPNSKLHRFHDLGHAPQISDPERFHAVVLKFLCS
jgi:pimeloyl-ACP methyl ester carboxylesterase